jgi:putative FmdB family regulatory protein
VPTYEYACRQCGEHLEVVQKFTDDPLTTCPACSGALRKVFGNIGISFKGSGFYKNDSRASSNGAKKESSSSEGGSSGNADSTGSTDKPKVDANAKSDTPKVDPPKKDKGSSTAAAS